MRFPMNDGTRCYVETRVPGLELDTDYPDYLVTTKSRTELAALRVWLKEHGHLPLRPVHTPVLSPLWAHNAAVLTEFHRQYPPTARDRTDPRHVDPTPDVHVLYRIDAGSPPYLSLDDLPPLTYLELVQLPKRVRRRRRA